MNRDTRDLISILIDYTDGGALPVVIQRQFAGHQMDNAAREGNFCSPCDESVICPARGRQGDSRQ
jgi:hypothetical protein